MSSADHPSCADVARNPQSPSPLKSRGATMSYARNPYARTLLSQTAFPPRGLPATLPTDCARHRYFTRSRAVSLPLIGLDHSPDRWLLAADSPPTATLVPSRLSRSADLASRAAGACLRFRQPIVRVW